MTFSWLDNQVSAELLELAESVAKATGSLLMNRPDTFTLTEKSSAVDFATQMDQQAEKMIVEKLLAARPDDGIVAEEGSARESKSGITWVIDPIDGTKNYVRGVPVWATLIALRTSQGMQLGVVSSPALGRRWYASKGDGAFVIDNLADKSKVRKLSCSQVGQLSDASMSVSSFDKKEGWKDLQPNLLKLSEMVWRNRGYGDFWSHMLVAEGALDFALEPQLALWDMAALEVIVNEAGGRFSNFTGIDGSSGPGAISSNHLLHDLVLTQLK